MAGAVVIPTKIMAGESLSNVIDVSLGEAAYVLMPAEWDGANLSFQVSFDDINYWDLFDELGEEVILACRPMTAVRIAPGMRAIGYVKIRSGTREAPIVQSVDRDFKVVAERTVVGP